MAPPAFALAVLAADQIVTFLLQRRLLRGVSRSRQRDERKHQQDHPHLSLQGSRARLSAAAGVLCLDPGIAKVKALTQQFGRTPVRRGASLLVARMHTPSYTGAIGVAESDALAILLDHQHSERREEDHEDEGEERSSAHRPGPTARLGRDLRPRHA